MINHFRKFANSLKRKILTVCFKEEQPAAAEVNIQDGCEALPPKRMGLCLVCDRPITEPRCSFHSSRSNFLFSTGADAGRYDNDMGCGDIYLWACCGAREPSQVNGGSESPPPRSPGCVTLPDHKRTASIVILCSNDRTKQMHVVKSVFEDAGIHLNIHSLDADLNFLAEADCVICIVDFEDHHAGIRLIQTFEMGGVNVPYSIFAEGAQLNQLSIQAESATSISPTDLLESGLECLRRAPHVDPWSPDVFISYPRCERVLVDEYVHSFSSRFLCWYDKIMLAPGVVWANEIFRGISNTKIFLLIVTQQTPDPTYCWRELEAALKAGKTIIVACHGETLSRIYAALGVEERELRSIQFTGLWDEEKNLALTVVGQSNIALLKPIPAGRTYRDVLNHIWGVTNLIADLLKENAPTVVDLRAKWQEMRAAH
jgi:hypothetical protein